MQYEATAKYLRVSTRKARLVADVVRKMSVDTALQQLHLMPKKSADIILKVLMSALSNAKGRNVSSDQLRIVSIDVMGGPSMKRWHAASKGMAHPYKKRMTHIKIVLTDEKQDIKKEVGDGGK